MRSQQKAAVITISAFEATTHLPAGTCFNLTLTIEALMYR